MPALYLTSFNSATPVPLFKKKGIAYLMPGKVGETRVLVNDENSFLYPIHYLQMVIMAISTHCVAELIQGFKNVFKEIPVHFSFEVPVCTFRFTKLDASQVTNLKSMGLMQDLTNANLFTGSPSASHLGVLMKMPLADDRLRPGFVNAAGFLTYTFLMKGITAFITARNNTDGRANMRYSLKTSVKFDQEGDILRVGKDIFKGKHGFSSGRSVITSNDVFIHPPKENMSAFPGSITQLDVAKSMPDSTTGFFFPYFRGLNVPDKTYAVRAFQNLFPNLVGKDFEQNAAVMGRILEGGPSLSYSYAGMAISHIYRCMMLSLLLEDAALTVLVKNSTYIGMIIACRPGIELRQYGRSYTSGPIIDEIRKVDLLESQAEKICGLLNGGSMEIDGVVGKKYVTTDFLTSRSALRSWNSIQRDLYAASDLLPQVEKLILDMDFQDTFPPISVENLKSAVTAMLTKDFGALSSYPAFLTKTTLYNRSPIAEALSMFGPSVPSFNTAAKGVSISIPGSDKEDGNLVRKEGIRPLKYLPIWAVPIQTGITQWEAVLSRGGFTMPGPKKNSKEFVDTHRVVLQIGSEADLTQIYNGVKSLVEAERVRAKQGMKRSRDDPEGTSVSKRAKAKESGLMDDAF